MARGGGGRLGRSGNSRLLLIILVVTALFFITLDLRGVGITSTSRTSTQTVLSPLQKASTNFFAPVGRFFSDIKNFGKVQAELKDLQKQNAELKTALVVNKDVAGQLKQLKAVLDLGGRGGYKVVASRVIGHSSSSSFSQTISIDAGSRDGISVNQTVISEYGFVGVVKNVTSHSALVLLMSDPSFKMGVRIARNQSVGVLTGQGGNTYKVELLDPAGTILKGDLLISNGSDGNRPFIPGVPVGYIISTDQTSAVLTQTGVAKSYSNLGALGVVSVVISAPTSQPRVPLSPTPQRTVIVYVTPTPSASVGTSTSPTGTPSPKVTK